jgi:hypothetical protein
MESKSTFKWLNDLDFFRSQDLGQRKNEPGKRGKWLINNFHPVYDKTHSNGCLNYDKILTQMANKSEPKIK